MGKSELSVESYSIVYAFSAAMFFALVFSTNQHSLVAFRASKFPECLETIQKEVSSVLEHRRDIVRPEEPLVVVHAADTDIHPIRRILILLFNILSVVIGLGLDHDRTFLFVPLWVKFGLIPNGDVR